jgi:hypothetical protein
MSALEIARWVADLLIPLPYMIAGIFLYKYTREEGSAWKLFLLFIALFFVGGVLEAFAYGGGGS